MRQRIACYVVISALLAAWPHVVTADQLAVAGKIIQFRTFSSINPDEPETHGIVYVWIDAPISSPCSANSTFVISPDTPEKEFWMLMDTIFLASVSGARVSIRYLDDLDQFGFPIFCYGNRPIIHSILLVSP